MKWSFKFVWRHTIYFLPLCIQLYSCPNFSLLSDKMLKGINHDQRNSLAWSDKHAHKYTQLMANWDLNWKRVSKECLRMIFVISQNFRSLKSFYIAIVLFRIMNLWIFRCWVIRALSSRYLNLLYIKEYTYKIATLIYENSKLLEHLLKMTKMGYNTNDREPCLLARINNNKILIFWICFTVIPQFLGKATFQIVHHVRHKNAHMGNKITTAELCL